MKYKNFFIVYYTIFTYIFGIFTDAGLVDVCSLNP
jgi:hypothetical protein